jgi:TP901 family phage tail tape measure protein
MVQFGMTAKDSAEAFSFSRKIIDSWSNVSHNSMVSANDLATALERSGSVAKQVGIDFDALVALTTTTARSTGLAGSNIGNMWKSVLGSIHDTKKSIPELEAFGVTVKKVAEDGTTSWIPVKDVLEQVMLKTAGTNKSIEELAKGMSGGKYQWAKLSSSVNEYTTYIQALDQSIMSTGSTVDYAGIQLETLSKKFEILKQHIVGLSVATGEGGLSTFLKDIVDIGTNLVAGFEKIDASTVEWTLGIAALSAGLGKLIPMFKALKVAEEELVVASATANALTGRWGNLIAGALVAGLGVYALSTGKAAEEQRKLNDAIAEATKTAPQIVDQYKRRAQEIDSILKNVERIKNELNSPETLSNPERKKKLEEDYKVTIQFFKDMAGIEFAPKIDTEKTIEQLKTIGAEAKRQLNSKADTSSFQIEMGKGEEVAIDNLVERYAQLKTVLQDTTLTESEKIKKTLELHTVTDKLVQLVPSLTDKYNDNGEHILKIDSLLQNHTGNLDKYSEEVKKIVDDARSEDLDKRISEQKTKQNQAYKDMEKARQDLADKRKKIAIDEENSQKTVEDRLYSKATNSPEQNAKELQELQATFDAKSKAYSDEKLKVEELQVAKGELSKTSKHEIELNEEATMGMADLGRVIDAHTSNSIALSKEQTSTLKVLNQAEHELNKTGELSSDTTQKLIKIKSDYTEAIGKGKDAVLEMVKAQKEEQVQGINSEIEKTKNLIKEVQARINFRILEAKAIEEVAKLEKQSQNPSSDIAGAEAEKRLTNKLNKMKEAPVSEEGKKIIAELEAEAQKLGIHLDGLNKTKEDLLKNDKGEKDAKKSADEVAQAYKNEQEHLQKLYEIKLKNNQADIANTEYLMSQAKKGSQEKIALIQKEIDLKQQRIKLLEEEKKREQEVAKNTPVSDSSSSVSVSGNGNASKIWSFLSSKGLNAHAVAGIMGNLQQENSLNTDDNSGGLGIAQWLGERRQGVIEYAKQIGASYESLEAQLGYLWKEISSGSQGVTVDKLNSMSASDATKYFSDKFERPGTPMMNKRMQYANEFYNQFSGSDVDGISKSMNTYVKVADEAALKTADFDSQIAKLKEEILKLSWDEITESLAGYDEANRKLDQDIEGSKSHLFQYNEASKEYRDELDKQIPLLKQKQDNLHLEAEAIRATLAANEQADEQHKLTAVQVDELNDKLQQLGISWWNLQEQVQKLNFDKVTSELNEQKQAIDDINTQLGISKATMELYNETSPQYRSELVKQTALLNQQIDVEQKLQKAIKDKMTSYKQDSTEYKELQKDLNDSLLKQLQMEKEIQNDRQNLYNQIADKLSTLKQDALDYMKQQHDKQEQNLEDNIKAVEKSYDNQIDAQEKKLKLLDDEIDKQERIKKLNEVNEELNNALNDKRTEYITSDGRKILSFDHEKVTQLQKQRDELLQQYQRDDIKKAIQDEVDRLKKAKEDTLDTLKKQLDETKTKDQQLEEETSRHWDRLIQAAKDGTLTQSQLMDSWFNGQISSMGNFRGEVTNLVSQIKAAYEALNQIQIKPVVIPPPIYSLPGVPTQWYTPSPNYSGGSNSGTDSWSHNPSSGYSDGSSSWSTTDNNRSDDYNNTRDGDGDRGNSYNGGSGSSGNISPPSFDTGGYTGSGFTDGKLAILHQKELVLNQVDTSNILKAVNLVRNLPKLIMPNLSSIMNKQPQNVDQSTVYNISNVTVKTDDALSFLDSMRVLVRSQTT